MTKWHRAAEIIAKTSKHPKHKMAALIFRGGRMLSVRCNGEQTGRHAELRAVARDRDFSGADIVIVRSNGEKVSRPCRSCFLVIKQAGIKRMYFTDESGQQVMRKVSQENELDYRDYLLERW